MTAPLAGVRVIEMGQLIAVPWATKMLADMGAQVIRLESCERLESYRTDALLPKLGRRRILEPGWEFLRAQPQQARHHAGPCPNPRGWLSCEI